MSARSDYDTARQRQMRVSTLAEFLAPMFKEKFDFSEKGPQEVSDFEKLADMAYRQADALLAKGEKALGDIHAKHEPLIDRERMNAQLAKEEADHV
jgi:hypothetical protein